MISKNKFLQSTQTLNTERLSQDVNHMQNYKKISQVFINPLPTKHLLKFPKNKTLRKQTQMNTTIQSIHNPQKSSIKIFQQASKTTLFNDKVTKRISKYGQYNPLASSKSMEKLSILPQPRTFQDIGAKKNMKKIQYNLKYKPDSVMNYSNSTTLLNKNLSKIWNEPRKIRDNGNQTKQSLIWKVDSAVNVKRAIYNQTNKLNKIDSQGSFIDMLNYSRRK